MALEFKPLRNSASLQVMNEKNWGFGFFVSDVIRNVGFWPFLAVGT